MQWLRYRRELILEILKPARMKSLAQGLSHYKPAGRRLSHDGQGFWEDSPPKLGSVAPLFLCCALSACILFCSSIYPLLSHFPWLVSLKDSLSFGNKGSTITLIHFVSETITISSSTIPLNVGMSGTMPPAPQERECWLSQLWFSRVMEHLTILPDLLFIQQYLLSIYFV